MISYILKGRLIDGISDTPIENGLVAVEGSCIVYAGAETGFDAAAFDTDNSTTLLDAGTGTILPGFIDCHAHLFGDENAGSFADGKIFGDQLLGAAYQCGLLLDAGFTSLRDMSENGLYLSRAVERGILRGPKIMPGGKILGITSGHVDMNPSLSKEELNRLDHTSRLVDGPWDCVQGVREQFRAGAKFIKICATGGVSSPTDRLDDVQFSPEELKAIADEAKRHHSYVCAHCTGYEGTYQALLSGITCIEHGVYLTQREIDLMKELDATLVTTLAVSLGVANIPGLPEWMEKKVKTCAAANVKTIEMARKAGIRIALGTDFSNSPNSPYLENGKEFAAMCRAGMTPMEAIKAGTSNAAHLLCEDASTGCLTPGKLADIVIVDGNPLSDISCLTHADHVKMVMVDGEMKKENLQ
ncbi:MAG: amidohydrolase family protein [Emergencia sp.]|nr:amidohydrolase family protein [Emergencia sp.]